MGFVLGESLGKDYEPNLHIADEKNAKIKQFIQKAPDEIDRAIKWSKHVQTYNPNLWKKVQQKDPNISAQLDFLASASATLKKDPQKANELIKKYNTIAENVNSTVNGVLKSEKKSNEKQITGASKLSLGELSNIPENQLTPIEKKQLKQIAKAAMKEIFPESLTEKTIKSWTGQSELYSSQRIALAPAVGVENVVKSLLSLFQIETYNNLAGSAEIILNLTKGDIADIYNGMKITLENIDATDTITPAISIIFSLIFFFGGTSKLLELTSKLKNADKIKKIVSSVRVLNPMKQISHSITTYTPLIVFTGMSEKVNTLVQ